MFQRPTVRNCYSCGRGESPKGGGLPGSGWSSGQIDGEGGMVMVNDGLRTLARAARAKPFADRFWPVLRDAQDH